MVDPLAHAIYIRCVDLHPVRFDVTSASRCFRTLVRFALQYQLALFQIDSLRKDGRFVGVDGSIPEGQGIVMAHLNECHELVEMVSSIKRFVDVCSSCTSAQRVNGRR